MSSNIISFITLGCVHCTCCANYGDNNASETCRTCSAKSNFKTSSKTSKMSYVQFKKSLEFKGYFGIKNI